MQQMILKIFGKMLSSNVKFVNVLWRSDVILHFCLLFLVFLLLAHRRILLIFIFLERDIAGEFLKCQLLKHHKLNWGGQICQNLGKIKRTQHFNTCLLSHLRLRATVRVVSGC